MLLVETEGSPSFWDFRCQQVFSDDGRNGKGRAPGGAQALAFLISSTSSGTALNRSATSP